MAFPIFGYFIMLLVMSNPAVTAAAQSDAYAAIFSASNPEEFVTALNTYLNQTFFNSNSQTNYLVKETGTPINNRTLEASYSIQQQFTDNTHSVKAAKLEFLVLLGTASPSTFQVRIFEGSALKQSKLVTVSNSAVWNVVQLDQQLTGTISVNITGVTTHTGDKIPSYSHSNMINQNPWSLALTSQYYHTYTYTTYVTVTQKVYDPIEHRYYYIEVQKPVTNIGWKTDSISENPAIRIENIDNLSTTYEVGSLLNGHYQIYKNSYKNHAVILHTLKGYADYSNKLGYKVLPSGTDPNFATDGVSLDQLLGEFMLDEGLASTPFDLNAYLELLFTFLQDPGNQSDTVWQTVANDFAQLMYSINGPYDNTHPIKYKLSDYWPQGGEAGHYMGLYKQIWSVIPMCTKYTNIQDPITGIVSRVCVEYSTTDYELHLNSSTLLGKLGLTSQIGFPSSLENIVLLKTPEMVTYPEEPYFFNWMAKLSQTVKGTVFSQAFMSELAASTPISPSIKTTANFINPLQVLINTTSLTGTSIVGPVTVTVKDLPGNVKGIGQVENGLGYFTTTHEINPNDIVSVESNFYRTATVMGTMPAISQTITNTSMILDPNAPTGMNPFVADIVIKDSQGNMAMGSLPVVLYDTDNNPINTTTSTNGTVQITLPKYYPGATAAVGGNDFYIGSAGTGVAQYDLARMVRTLGPAGSDPVANAKFTIIKDYIEHSGAFSYNSATENYTWNGNDKFNGQTGCYKWTDNLWPYPSVDRGYCVISAAPISKSELNSSTFDSGTFVVRKYWGEGFPVYQMQTGTQIPDYTLNKLDFFTMWLGQKLEPTSYGGNPHDPSGYTQLNALASDFSVFLSKDQSYFVNGGSTAQQFSAKVRGLLDTATNLGFSTPKGFVEQLIDFVNAIMSAFVDAIASIWNAIVSFVGAVADFVMTVWNNVVGPVLGAAIEAVKNVVTVLFNQILNTIVQPMLSGQTMSLTNLFEGDSSEYLETKSQNILNSIGSEINTQSSQLDSVGSSIQSLMSVGSVFSGSGSIFEPLISVAGPGIMSTIFDIISSTILNSLLTPLFSQFSTPVLENNFNTLTSNVGGTQNFTLNIMNKVTQMSTVTQKSGTTKSHYGSGISTQTTGSKDPTGETIVSFDKLASVESDSSSSCGISNLGQCLNELFQWLISIGKVVLDEINGIFSSLVNFVGIILNSLKNIMQAPDQKYVVLGALSSINNFLGYIKTKVPDVFNVALIQFIRLIIDFLQLFLSIHYYSTSSSVIDTVSQLWFWKSIMSTLTDIFSFLDNFNDINQYFNGLMSMFGLGNVWAKAMTFKRATNLLRSISSLIGGLLIYLVFKFKVSSLTQVEAGWAKLFMYLYVMESILKTILYFSRVWGNRILLLEQVIYITSSILDIFQILVSVFVT